MKHLDLPIHTALPALRGVLASRRAAVLQAPPGAGKSTIVPLALLEEPWARGKRIVMLEPRRLAARAVAQRMAQTLEESVGITVGYRMRLDTRVSRATRIEVVTEGVLARMLQSDPALEGVGLVIFDEFHERSLQADLGLALTLDARDTVAPELRLLVMSATFDAAPIAELIGDAAIVTAEGRAFSVETRYVGKGAPPLPRAAGAQRRQSTSRSGGKSPEQLVALIVSRALRETAGDMLVFLPGAGEIRRVRSLLDAMPLDATLSEAAPSAAAMPDAGASRAAASDPVPEDASRPTRAAAVRVYPLFGDLDAAAQRAAVAPSRPGERKIVLATNIAETSLTIEGVTVVVDSGLVRRALFDPATGMGRLETQRISRASAEQRLGRAGRTAPGICYRAWSEEAHRGLAPATPPEILAADLAPLALELANWGIADAGALRWLDSPPAAMIGSARDLLTRLGALDSMGRITAHGRRMAQLAVHPRLAHMLLAADRLGCLPLGAQLAALLSDRDLLRGDPAARDLDIRTRLALLRKGSGSAGEAGQGGAHVEHDAARRAKRFARELERQLGRASATAAPVSTAVEARAGASSTSGDDDGLVGVLLAFAYPDRIARRRPGADRRYTLANGRGAALVEAHRLARDEYLVAIDVDDRDRDARILLAAPIAESDIERHFDADLERASEVAWSSREQAVIARRTVRLGALVLGEKPLPEVPGELATTAMLAGIRELGIDALPWTPEALDLQARVEFVRRIDLQAAAGTTDWPAVDDASLLAAVEEWLAPWLEGMMRREHLTRLPLLDALKARIGWERLRRLDELAPSRLEVPSGSHIRIDYRDDSAPVVAVRLQEVFGLRESPKLAGGRAPVTFKLLSPAARPVQVTRDLESFWRSTYAEVRRDLRGRYPKHYWPEDPHEAQATRSLRPRRS